MSNQYIPPLPFVTWDEDSQEHLNDLERCVKLMVDAYLECAVWADGPDDEDWGDAEVSNQTETLAHFECCAFLRLARWHIKDWSMSQLGHDFWLTRNGHGTGFWDREFGTQESRDRLTEISELFGSASAYLGDDGKIYIE